MNIFQKVTLKNLRQNPSRTLVTIIGILLSLAMFTAVTTSLSSCRSYLLERTLIRDGNWHGQVFVTQQEKASLTEDKAIEETSFLERIGYAQLTGGTNADKPYLYIGGMDENAHDMLPLLLSEGRLPENEDELLIPSHLAYNGGVTYHLNETLTLDIGRRTAPDAQGESILLTQKNSFLGTAEAAEEAGFQEPESFSADFSHTYKIVGFYERPPFESFTAPGYTVLTMSSPEDSGTYDAFLRFYSPKEALPWLNAHFPDAYTDNSDLLRMYGASYETSFTSVLYGLAAVLIFIILFGSISLIYNAFSISVTERTRQFGLLASLGATRKQMIGSVLFEGFLLCGIGIPLGILAGILGMGITFHLLGSSISDIFFGNESWVLPLTLHVSPAAVIAAVLIGLFTVLVSAYLPARRAAKLSPMEAIRQTTDITIRSGKIKTSKLTARLFGLPGMLAAKNFKRNRKRYRATVISLFVSVVLFISASSFCSYLLSATESIIGDAGADIVYYRYRNSTALSNDTVLKQLSAVEGITGSAWLQRGHSVISIKETAMNPDYLSYLKKNELEGLTPSFQGQVSLDTDLYFISDHAYKAYLQENGLSISVFLNAERPLAVASDFFRVYQGDSGKYAAFHQLKQKAPLTASMLQLHVPEGYVDYGYETSDNGNRTYQFYNTETEQIIRVPEASCTTQASMIIGAFADNVPFFLGEHYAGGLVLLYPSSAMDAVLGEGERDDYTEFYFTAANHKSAAADISMELKNMGLDGSAVYDQAENAAQQRTMATIVSIFSYGFIILISLIAAANVFNTISTNIQLRKREFAMLKSTGMTPGGFRVMMCYECLLYGIKGLLYGLPVSILVTWFIYRSIARGWETGFYIPWHSLLIAVGSVFLVVGITMLYSMRKIRTEHMMEHLKNENA